MSEIFELPPHRRMPLFELPSVIEGIPAEPPHVEVDRERLRSAAQLGVLHPRPTASHRAAQINNGGIAAPLLERAARWFAAGHARITYPLVTGERVFIALDKPHVALLTALIDAGRDGVELIERADNFKSRADLGSPSALAKRISNLRRLGLVIVTSEAGPTYLLTRDVSVDVPAEDAMSCPALWDAAPRGLLIEQAEEERRQAVHAAHLALHEQRRLIPADQRDALNRVLKDLQSVLMSWPSASTETGEQA